MTVFINPFASNQQRLLIEICSFSLAGSLLYWSKEEVSLYQIKKKNLIILLFSSFLGKEERVNFVANYSNGLFIKNSVNFIKQKQT